MVSSRVSLRVRRCGCRVEVLTGLSLPAGCTISGSGPTAVAICDSMAQAEKVKKAMCDAYSVEGKLQINSAVITKLGAGARKVKL